VIHIATTDPNGRLAVNPKYYLSAMSSTGNLATARKDTSSVLNNGIALMVTVPKMQDVSLFVDSDWSVVDTRSGVAIPTKTPGPLIPGSSQSDVQITLAIQ
jgi:hypothetical protein